MKDEDDTRVAKGRHIDKKRIERFLNFIKDRKQSSKILDIGCQSGDLCSQLKELGHEPYGVELIDELVNKAQSEHPSLVFIKADAEKLIPFSDNYFDIVWAGDVIEHIRFTDVFVNEVNRVLKKGGLFILTTPMHNRLKTILLTLHKFEEHFDPEFPHLRFYSVKSLKSVLEKRGFRLESVEYMGRIPPIAKIIFAVSRKQNDKKVFSKYRF